MPKGPTNKRKILQALIDHGGSMTTKELCMLDISYWGQYISVLRQEGIFISIQKNTLNHQAVYTLDTPVEDIDRDKAKTKRPKGICMDCNKAEIVTMNRCITCYHRWRKEIRKKGDKRIEKLLKVQEVYPNPKLLQPLPPDKFEKAVYKILNPYGEVSHE